MQRQVQPAQVCTQAAPTGPHPRERRRALISHWAGPVKTSSAPSPRPGPSLAQFSFVLLAHPPSNHLWRFHLPADSTPSASASLCPIPSHWTRSRPAASPRSNQSPARLPNSEGQSVSRLQWLLLAAHPQSKLLLCGFKHRRRLSFTCLKPSPCQGARQ